MNASFLFLLICLNQLALAQKDSIKPRQNIIYIEAAGIGGYGSVNYERVLLQKNSFMFSARMGISTYHLKDYTNRLNPDLLVPISVYACLGKNNKLELGTGLTYANIVQADFTDYKPVRTTNLYPDFDIGYRYQNAAKGYFFRLAYTPTISNHQYKNWGGASVGYAF